MRPEELVRPRFVLDVHLGRLARWLRLVGFDTSWRNDFEDEELARLATEQGRILLSRDRGLLARVARGERAVGAYVEATDRREQILEVLTRFDLFDAVEPFGRCLECNGLLRSVPKSEVVDRLPPRTRRDYDAFERCSGCGRVYWRGSHYDRLRQVVEDIERHGPSPMVQGALAACRRGWSVVPLHAVLVGRCSCGDPGCPAPGKHPRLAWEPFMEARASEQIVGQWWRRWPTANVGVVTGPVSGLVVLDVDPRHGGDEDVADLELFHGRLPVTVESLTGGGGVHLYFCHPGVPVPSGPLTPGLDLKGDGGLVVCPPSRHRSGRRYTWESGRAPEEIGLADPPAWLVSVPADPRGPDAARGPGSGRGPGGGGRSGRGGHGHHREPPPRTVGERREFAALWRRVGIELRPGDEYYLCPFHPDHHPSLHVDAEGCRFYCFGCGRGGGAGRLRRLVGLRPPLCTLPTRPPEPPRPPGTGAPATPGTGATATTGSGATATTGTGAPTMAGAGEVEVVGTSRHQDALLRLAGGRRPYGGLHVETVARLVPEPDNRADRDAIAVTVGGETVGYLSRGDAARLSRSVRATIKLCGEASCAAVIVGGWERPHGDVGALGMRLRV